MKKLKKILPSIAITTISSLAFPLVSYAEITENNAHALTSKDLINNSYTYKFDDIFFGRETYSCYGDGNENSGFCDVIKQDRTIPLEDQKLVNSNNPLNAELNFLKTDSKQNIKLDAFYYDYETQCYFNTRSSDETLRNINQCYDNNEKVICNIDFIDNKQTSFEIVKNDDTSISLKFTLETKNSLDSKQLKCIQNIENIKLYQQSNYSQKETELQAIRLTYLESLYFLNIAINDFATTSKQKVELQQQQQKWQKQIESKCGILDQNIEVTVENIDTLIKQYYCYNEEVQNNQNKLAQ